jgi:hypothetical protein
MFARDYFRLLASAYSSMAELPHAHGSRAKKVPKLRMRVVRLDVISKDVVHSSERPGG